LLLLLEGSISLVLEISLKTTIRSSFPNQPVLILFIKHETRE
jgi:hypothetical protein